MEKIPVNRYVKRMGDLKTNKQTNKPTLCNFFTALWLLKVLMQKCKRKEKSYTTAKKKLSQRLHKNLARIFVKYR